MASNVPDTDTLNKWALYMLGQIDTKNYEALRKTAQEAGMSGMGHVVVNFVKIDINPIAYAAYVNDIEALEIMREAGADMKQACFDQKGMDALMIGLVRYTSPRVITYFKELGFEMKPVERSPGDIISMIDDPLIDAHMSDPVLRKKIEGNIIAYLENGGEFRTLCYDGMTDFDRAVQYGSKSVVDKMVEIAGDDILLETGQDGLKPLGRAIRNGSSDMFDHLIAKKLPLDNLNVDKENAIGIATKAVANASGDDKENAKRFFNKVSAAYVHALTKPKFFSKEDLPGFTITTTSRRALKDLK